MSSSYSSIARYRPAILAITAIAAGCTIYYIHNLSWSASSSQQSLAPNSLHRSNALRRNRPPPEADVSEPNNHGEQAAAEDTGAPNVVAGAGHLLPNGLRPAVNEEPAVEHQVLEERETVVDTESLHSWRDESDGEDASKKGHSLMSLLYRIAEDQATKEGYVHRGVTCNSCNTMPIRGIRYRCANCIGFDLCETCESMEVHHKTHLFYKIRIPAPILNTPRQPQPVWYPGKPASVVQPLPTDVKMKYCKETGYQISEVTALWEQFRCLAATELIEDSDHYNLAIDRPTFDKCFVHNTNLRPLPPNLIYDRMFALYDTNRDGLISFSEFIKALSSLTKQKWDERRKKIFDGYDINGDGYVDRKDFLRMFRAFYALTKEMIKGVVTAMDEDLYEGGAREIVTSSQPISSAFAGAIPLGEGSRTLAGKVQDESGDYVIDDDGGAVRESEEDTGDHNEAVADAVEAAYYGPFAGSQKQQAIDLRYFDESMLDDEENRDVWPPTYVIAEDVMEALGSKVPFEDIEDIEDPSEREEIRRASAERIRQVKDRSRKIRDQGVHQRWERQQFYLGDEDGAIPPDNFEQDNSAETQPPSRRSRSSSKVRFQDDLTTDDEHETRSATSVSSRSIPVGERWGGYEVPEAEKDVGREILYQVAQESLNELLDPIFQQKEDFAIMARGTKREREFFRSHISTFGTDAVRQRVKRIIEELEWKWRNLSLTYQTLEENFVDDLIESPNDPSSVNEKYQPIRGESVGLERPPDPNHQSPTTEITPEPTSSTTSLTKLDTPTETTPETTSSTTPLTNPDIQQHPTTPSPSSPTPDPTLPQNRPSNPSPSPFSSTSLSPSSSSPPSEERLRFLLAMDMIEAEDGMRGGPGRLSFAEFEELLMGTKGSGLEFVGSWLEMVGL